MSAFICMPDHFKALAIFAASRNGSGFNVDPRYIPDLDREGVYKLRGLNNLLPHELATVYAETLFSENVRSVRHRYPGEPLDNLPGPCDLPAHITITPRDELNKAYRLPPVSILKMCDCLEYQSNETEGYKHTPGYNLLQDIRLAAIRKLPGYDAAPWDYEATEQKAA